MVAHCYLLLWRGVAKMVLHQKHPCYCFGGNKTWKSVMQTKNRERSHWKKGGKKSLTILKSTYLDDCFWVSILSLNYGWLRQSAIDQSNCVSPSSSQQPPATTCWLVGKYTFFPLNLRLPGNRQPVCRPVWRGPKVKQSKIHFLIQQNQKQSLLVTQPMFANNCFLM